MEKLAIKGHPTRGNEVIEILEMLGGKNVFNLNGDEKFGYYLIEENEIKGGLSIFGCETSILFTLEEFLERFTYKVGDKVYYNNRVCDIIDMRWNSNLNTISYGISDCRITNLATVEELQPYKKETMKGKIDSFEILESHCADEVKIEFDPNKFEIVERKEGYYVVKKQPQYPKTYIECCRVLNHSLEDDCVGGYKDYLLENLQKLIICRDTYWKIAGEQMGLNKSWEPDWLNVEQDKYVLYTHNNNICSNCYVLGHNILAFPTAEMRDAFFENFKDLIENCKELL